MNETDLKDHSGKLDVERHFSTLGRTKLRCSKIGFGSYRVSHEIEAHKKALVQALENGVNLIDTSSNYANGGSEKLIGKVLNEKKIDRDKLILVSKVGYIQGDNYDLAAMRENQGKPYAEVVKYGEGIWHCIHPEFILDQLTLSLGRLDQDHIDVYLLHNPEYYFLDLVKTSGTEDIEKAQFTFYDRIRRAFAILEDLVDEGKIRHYGVSSNTIADPTTSMTSVHLPTLLAIAEQISIDKHGTADKHHFSVVQCPLNLIETNALAVKDCDKQSLLDYAAEKNLGVLVNRPLNAIVHDRLIRLARFDVKHRTPDIESHAQKLGQLEDDFLADFSVHIQPIVKKHGKPFKIAEHLNLEELKKLTSAQWREFSGTYFISEVLNLIHSFDPIFAEKANVSNNWSLWKSNYLETLRQFIEHVLSETESTENKRTEMLAQALENNGVSGEGTLSQKCIAALCSLPQVSSVLVGMRQEAYVQDSCTALSLLPNLDAGRIAKWMEERQGSVILEA